MLGKFQEICRVNGWKCPAQRLAIYKFLDHNTTHPDVQSTWEKVRQELPTITRESVYRILNEFAEHHLIQRMDHLETAHYDTNTASHGHFFCEKCGAIIDFALPPEIRLCDEYKGGKVRTVEVRAVGICQRCTEQIEQAKKPEVSTAEHNNF